MLKQCIYWVLITVLGLIGSESFATPGLPKVANDFAQGVAKYTQTTSRFRFQLAL